MSSPESPQVGLTADEFAMGVYATQAAIKQGDMTPSDGLKLLDTMSTLYPEQHSEMIGVDGHMLSVSQRKVDMLLRFASTDTNLSNNQ